MSIPSITLHNQVKIPMLGFGVFRTAPGKETQNSVLEALKAGYRHIDTAVIYQNEEDVGTAIAKSGIPREDIFLTTKLWNDDMRNHRQFQAFEESLKKLGTDYIDLYLMHWPAGDIIESWSVLEEFYKSGKVRAIGVSNFEQHHLEELLPSCNIVPMIDQMECHPFLAKDSLRSFCNTLGIAFQAYSPLGGQGSPILKSPYIVELAKRYNKSEAQIVLRWHIQRNTIIMPKSTHVQRIRSNTELFDFELSEEDMQLICSLDCGQRFGADPDNFDF